MEVKNHINNTLHIYISNTLNRGGRWIEVSNTAVYWQMNRDFWKVCLLSVFWKTLEGYIYLVRWYYGSEVRYLFKLFKTSIWPPVSQLLIYEGRARPRSASRWACKHHAGWKLTGSHTVQFILDIGFQCASSLFLFLEVALKWFVGLVAFLEKTALLRMVKRSVTIVTHRANRLNLFLLSLHVKTCKQVLQNFAGCWSESAFISKCKKSSIFFFFHFSSKGE